MEEFLREQFEFYKKKYGLMDVTFSYSVDWREKYIYNYSLKRIVISLFDDHPCHKEKVLRILLHEIAHAIQDKVGKLKVDNPIYIWNQELAAERI